MCNAPRSLTHIERSISEIELLAATDSACIDISEPSIVDQSRPCERQRNDII